MLAVWLFVTSIHGTHARHAKSSVKNEVSPLLSAAEHTVVIILNVHGARHGIITMYSVPTRCGLSLCSKCY